MEKTCEEIGLDRAALELLRLVRSLGWSSEGYFWCLLLILLPLPHLKKHVAQLIASFLALEWCLVGLFSTIGSFPCWATLGICFFVCIQYFFRVGRVYFPILSLRKAKFPGRLASRRHSLDLLRLFLLQYSVLFFVQFCKQASIIFSILPEIWWRNGRYVCLWVNTDRMTVLPLARCQIHQIILVFSQLFEHRPA